MYYNSPCEVLKIERKNGFNLLHYTNDRKYNIITLTNKFNEKKMILLTKDNKFYLSKVKFNQ